MVVYQRKNPPREFIIVGFSKILLTSSLANNDEQINIMQLMAVKATFPSIKLLTAAEAQLF